MSEPFRFDVEPTGAVVRINDADGSRCVIFRAASKAKGDAFMEAYLALSIENRRKLRDACAP